MGADRMMRDTTFSSCTISTFRAERAARVRAAAESGSSRSAIFRVCAARLSGMNVVAGAAASLSDSAVSTARAEESDIPEVAARMRSAP
ncbi:hypothetical protein BJF85_11945 [Saccharomonospora sp. CUA-673]|nr:hypothetical protein BJF85_11945 [Saccharomonospora sp. CUA-673]